MPRFGTRSLSVLVGVTCVAASVQTVCQEIAAAISNSSAVFWPGSDEYVADITHWAASSQQSSVCSVEPGTSADVATILKIVGAHRTPFAVKGGGHATNPRFSSTTGVQIAMSRFSDVIYDAAAQTATIGAGLLWDDVYAQLEPHNVNVVGGRISGVGVAGFTLGGGYSFKSNQYGLTIDTVVAYELVTPLGVVRLVTAKDADIFWALKGGGNRLGIVTRFTLKTFPQTQVWGGLAVYPEASIPALRNATLAFDAQTDRKAEIIPSIDVLPTMTVASLNVFYDGPTPPDGLFDAFLAIPALSLDLKTRSFLSLLLSSPPTPNGLTRDLFATVDVPNFGAKIIDAIIDEALTLGPALTANSSAQLVSYGMEPFLRGYLTRKTRTSDSAFPPSRRHGMPLSISYAWTSAQDDDQLRAVARASAARIQRLASAAAPPLGKYPNYSLFDTPIEQIFGSNVERLRRVVRSVDPHGVMNQTGWFKL